MLINALVFGPKYPADGVMLCLIWNLINACLVREPKYVVSYPSEPGSPGVLMKKPC